MRQIKEVLGNVSRYRKTGIYFFITIMLMLAAAGVWKHQAIYDQLYDWKLIPRPERLTELYFTNHRDIPQTYKPAQKQTIAFTVHNLEYRPTAYSYTVTQKNTSGTTKTLARGSFSLQHDEQKAVSVRAAMADLGKRAKVDVTISYQGIAFGKDSPSTQKQSIYYWTDRKGASQ